MGGSENVMVTEALCPGSRCMSNASMEKTATEPSDCPGITAVQLSSLPSVSGPAPSFTRGISCCRVPFSVHVIFALRTPSSSVIIAVTVMFIMGRTVPSSGMGSSSIPLMRGDGFEMFPKLPGVGFSIGYQSSFELVSAPPLLLPMLHPCGTSSESTQLELSVEFHCPTAKRSSMSSASVVDERVSLNAQQTASTIRSSGSSRIT